MLAKVKCIRNVLVILVGVGALFQSMHAAYPTLMYHDPFPLYTVQGINDYAAMKSKGEEKLRWFHWHVSPFDQHASGARNIKGRKVTHGDRLGHWNACGFFFGDDASPTSAKLDFTQAYAAPPAANPQDATGSYPTLTAARNAISLAADENGAFTTEPGFAFDSQNDDNNNNGFFSVGTTYGRIGLRSVLYLEPSKYFRFEMGFGFSEYKYSGTFNSLLATEDPPAGSTELTQNLLNSTSLNKIANEVGIDLTRQRETVAEDLFIGIRLANTFTSNDDEGTPTVDLTPFLGVGFWVPTGTKSDPDKAFSLPGGNDGFFGYSFNAGLSLHILGMVHVSMRGAITAWTERELEGVRVPSSNTIMNGDITTFDIPGSYQVGFFPWKTNMNRRPGLSWDFSLSLCARHIIGGLSFYADYIYGKHEQDKITLKETDRIRADAFRPVVLEEKSFWKSQAFTVGASYEITPAVELGLAFQGHLSGQQVFKTETLLGTLKLSF